TTASIDGSTTTSTGGVAVTAETKAKIDALSFGIAGAIGGGESAGVGVAGAGTVSANTIHNTAQAIVKNSTVNAGGAFLVTAADGSVIDAFSGALAIAFGVGGSAGIGVSLGVSVSINDIANKASAIVDPSTVNSASSVLVSGTSTASINSFSVAGSFSAGAAGDVGVGFAGAGAVSPNSIPDPLQGPTADAAFNVPAAAPTQGSA